MESIRDIIRERDRNRQQDAAARATSLPDGFRSHLAYPTLTHPSLAHAPLEAPDEPRLRRD